MTTPSKEAIAEKAADKWFTHYAVVGDWSQARSLFLNLFQLAIEEATEGNNEKWRDSIAGKTRFCPCNDPPSLHGFDNHFPESRAAQPHERPAPADFPADLGETEVPDRLVEVKVDIGESAGNSDQRP